MWFRDWVPWKTYKARLKERERSTSRRSIAPAGHSAAANDLRQRHPAPVPFAGPPGETRPAPDQPNPASEPRPTPPGHGQAASQRSPVRKAHSLIDKVYRWDNLVLAWRRVRANKGAHGLDRVTIRMFEADWEKHLRGVQRELMQQRFTPTPVRRVYIPKAADPKKLRPLGIPTVADRIVQQAIVQIVDPLFDDSLSPRSFGFRQGRRAHDAIATALQDAREGFRSVVDADIASFFDRLDREVTMSRVRARIADGRVLDLIEAFLKAGVCEDGVVTVPTEGTPQGGVISPWLANLVLDDLDKAIEARGLRHVRYADDFVVLCKSRQEAEESLVFVKEVLGALKLSLHETKTRISDFDEGFEFLGFHFRHYHLGVRSKTIERFKERVRSLTKRQQGRNVDAVLKDLNPVIRGWSNYVGVAEVWSDFKALDRWIRMRVRSFRYKRRCRNDNWRLSNRRLERWGLLSLQQCRPKYRLSYACPAGP
jgi:RNA-directed DNA polymerase